MRAPHFSILATGLLLTGMIASPVRAEPQTALVFFTEWSAGFDQDAKETVQHVADIAKAGKDHKITITGFADTTGSETANKLLSQLRAQVVADKLVEDGVSADIITQKAAGETPAPDGSKQESRRTTIVVE